MDTKGRYIGIDVGARKTGIAISDDASMCAFPHKVVPTEDLYKTLEDIFERETIIMCVIGDSKTYSGKANEISKKIHDIENNLKDKGIEVALEDENLTTYEANRLEKRDDDASAAIILQRFLDRLNARNGTG